MRRRLIGLLLAALAPFVLVELGLRLAGFETPQDPYLAGFDEGTPIFRRVGDVVEVVPAQRRTWRTEPFSAARAPGSLRLFTVGDSITWGHHGNEFPGPLAAYSDLLQARLDELAPGADRRVLNVGARTFASGRVSRVVGEVLTFAPDVVFAYLGTSEHLEHMLEAQRDWQRRGLAGWLGRVRLFAALRARLVAASSGLTLEQIRARDGALKAPFVTDDAILPSDAARDALVETARQRLAALADLCHERGVPLLLATVPSNLRFPPFASRFDDPTARAALEATLVRAGELLQAGRAAEALALVGPEAAAHPEVAGLHYRLAQAREGVGDLAGARAEYLAARDTDACPARALGALNDAIRHLVPEHPGTTLVDVERLFEAAVPDGIPDDRLFLDNCHPTAEGHHLIAAELERVLTVSGLSPAPPPRAP